MNAHKNIEQAMDFVFEKTFIRKQALSVICRPKRKLPETLRSVHFEERGEAYG